MNQSNPNDVQAAIKAAHKDNPEIWTLSKTIANAHKKLEKQVATLTSELETIKTLPDEVSNDDVIAQLHQYLLAKLKDNTLQAGEIGQLKDLLGLTAKKQDIIINTISWADYEPPKKII